MGQPELSHRISDEFWPRASFHLSYRLMVPDKLGIYMRERLLAWTSSSNS
jgi:hypothetical protein